LSIERNPPYTAHALGSLRATQVFSSRPATSSFKPSCCPLTPPKTPIGWKVYVRRRNFQYAVPSVRALGGRFGLVCQNGLENSESVEELNGKGRGGCLTCSGNMQNISKNDMSESQRLLSRPSTEVQITVFFKRHIRH